jgi:predicted transcriptional regulator
MSVKDFLSGLVLEKAPGPYPSFSIFDVIKVLEIIAESGSIGRGKLSDELGLGEGATRTLLGRLTDAGLTVTMKSGCSLTERGKKIWGELKAILPRKVELEKNELTFAVYNVAVLVRHRGEGVGKGLEQRDAAVRAGAKGAITLIFKNGRLVLPAISEDLSKDFPIAFGQVAHSMEPKEDDAVIISGADQRKEAEYGALAAAWTIF